MQKKSNFILYLFTFFILSLLIFVLSLTGILKPVSDLSQGIFSPIQATIHGVLIKASSLNQNEQVKALKNENLDLKQKLVDQSKVIADNKALRDQFQTQDFSTLSLVPARVIGAPGFIQGISVPDTLILNKGASDGIKLNEAVIYKNNLIGKVVKVSSHFSSIDLITNQTISFTAKTLTTQSAGVVKGQSGNDMILDNVLLSEKLQAKDLVVTQKDVNSQGIGFPPDLIVGQIMSISKNPSDLFQKAELKSLVDFVKLDLVFVINNLR